MNNNTSSIKTVYFKYIAFILIALSMNIAYAQVPTNLTYVKQAIIQYYDSGEYDKDVTIEINNAEKYLDKRIKENNTSSSPQKLAMVLDIDDTSLTNYIGNKKRDFSGLPQLVDQSYQDANAPAIQPVLHLYNQAIKNNVSVFFISFRPEKFRSYTVANLKKAGYDGWSALYLPNFKQVKLPPKVYKTAIRQKLTQQGYAIILNLGDQDSDLQGGYAEYSVKIPNPLYSNVRRVN